MTVFSGSCDKVLYFLRILSCSPNFKDDSESAGSVSA
jgi:hypothetical protein